MEGEYSPVMSPVRSVRLDEEGIKTLNTKPAHTVVLVVDFGAQYAQLIARRVREAGVYAEIVPHSLPASEILARRPSAIILSGGPSSVYAQGAPQIDPMIFESNVPILGICYGFQLMAAALGGRVLKTERPEYGSTKFTTNPEDRNVLLQGIQGNLSVWMSHSDSVLDAPPGFRVVGTSAGSPVAAFESSSRKSAGVQFHPEVSHTDFGQLILENFLFNLAQCRKTWTESSIIDEQVRAIRLGVGDKKVICGLSGGVDSAVAAALVHRAIGDQLTCVFVDHGLLRMGEAEQVEKDYVVATGIKLKVVDATSQFLAALEGVTDPEKKRKIIGRHFIEAFEAAAQEIEAEHHIEFLVQGTLYPDVVESGGGAGAANIKSHHNVGGLPKDMKFKLIEPLRSLFKDEVRRIGRQLGLPESIVERHPFPGPGLAIRIVGQVTQERLEVLRIADYIVREEMTAADVDREIWQCPVILLPDVHSVGVQGDRRSYGFPVVLRPVSSEDAMTADWARLPYDLLGRISSRITNEVPEINRVLLDVTSKPPATIEWE